MGLIFEKPKMEDKSWINKVLAKEKRSDALAVFGRITLIQKYVNIKTYFLLVLIQIKHHIYFPKVRNQYLV